ncbi:MAG: Mrp/NBP35 family ATP-binding protein [Clostridia bacterium]|nr:Mrp/NBP35 family ATP-binding protein [Clostridia bacterium]
MSECTHDCANCASKCSSAGEHPSLIEPQNHFSHVKRVIGVVSGKGGVGKSLVTSMLAVSMQRRGFQTAILDADVTGPSIPKIFGMDDRRVEGNAEGLMLPPMTKTGIELMSVNLLLEDPEAPVVWRGSMISGAVKQFWTDTAWNEVDYMFVDMPPGTGDVPLTVFQSLPVDGILIVTSPQELVSMIVTKAVKMARMMNIPVLGLIENYSYLVCPDCGKKISVYGESHIAKVAMEQHLPVLAQIPIDPRLPALCDKGIIELMENDYLDATAEMLSKMKEHQ